MRTTIGCLFLIGVAVLGAVPASAQPEFARVSWTEARATCDARGKVLCTRRQVCVPSGPGSDGAPLDGPVGTPLAGIPTGDVWMAVGDWQNAWVSIGSSYGERRCRFHEDLGAAPGWGMTTGPLTEKPAAFQCCDPGTAYERPGPNQAWDMLQFTCEERGEILCSKEQVCPGGAVAEGKAPALGSPPGDVWMAVGDRHNAWISVGQSYPERLCRFHEHLGAAPDWGLTTGPLTGTPAALRCCNVNSSDGAVAVATRLQIKAARVAKVAPENVPAPPETKKGFTKPVSGEGPNKVKFGAITATGCADSGTRVYSARLWDIPLGASWEDACARTPATFGQLTFPSPTRCLNVGPGLEMWGEWDVPDNTCKIACEQRFCSHRGASGERWDNLDERCSGSRRALLSAQIMNVPGGASAEATCKSLPLTYKDTRYPAPTRCVTVGNGVWGEWDVPADACKVTSSGTGPNGAKFGSIVAKKCDKPGNRTYSAILWDIPWGKSWEDECKATSATIDGTLYATPTRCVNTWFNMWGEWDINDGTCPMWGVLYPVSCADTGVKTYRSYLDIPRDTSLGGYTNHQVKPGWDPLSLCRNLTAKVGGNQVHPTRCDVRYEKGKDTTEYVGTWGDWDVADAGCEVSQPVWGSITAKECVWIGWRLHSAVLWNIDAGISWEVMCERMPPVAVAGQPPMKAHCVNTTQQGIDRGTSVGGKAASGLGKVFDKKKVGLSSAVSFGTAVIGAFIGASTAKQWGEWYVPDESCIWTPLQYNLTKRPN